MPATSNPIPAMTTRRPAPSLFLLVVFAFASAGCSSVNKLAEHNYEGKTMAVTAPFAPRPEIFTDDPADTSENTERSGSRLMRTLAAVAEVASEVAEAFTAADAQAKLDSAAVIVDVSATVADGMKDEAIRYLNVVGTDDANAADYVLEVNIEKHGIFSGTNYDSRLEYRLEAKPVLMDNQTGEIIWRRTVKQDYPFTEGSTSRTLARTGNAIALSELTVDELALVLESMANDAARDIARKLSEDIRDAKK